MEFSRPECWSVFHFSRGSSQPRDQTQVSHTAGRFFTNWAIGVAKEKKKKKKEKKKYSDVNS